MRLNIGKESNKISAQVKVSTFESILLYFATRTTLASGYPPPNWDTLAIRQTSRIRYRDYQNSNLTFTR